MTDPTSPQVNRLLWEWVLYVESKGSLPKPPFSYYHDENKKPGIDFTDGVYRPKLKNGL